VTLWRAKSADEDLFRHMWADMHHEQAHERTTLRQRAYCDAAAEAAAEMGVPVVKLWDEIMAELGWIEGDRIPGQEGAPENRCLKEYFWDGKSFSRFLACFFPLQRLSMLEFLAERNNRTSFCRTGIQSSVQMPYKSY
jgi:hypothetical protein